MKDVDLNAIGLRLQLIRKQLKMQQKDFAKKLEISNSSLSVIEAGKGKPRFELIYNLTRKYNVNINYLLHGQGEMFKTDEAGKAFASIKSEEQVEFLQEFLHYFKESPFFRYAMMSFYKEFTLDNDKKIAKDIERHRTIKERKNL